MVPHDGRSFSQHGCFLDLTNSGQDIINYKVRDSEIRSDQPAKIEHDKSVARITLIVAQPAMPGQCSFAFALLLVDDTPFFIKTLYLT